MINKVKFISIPFSSTQASIAVINNVINKKYVQTLILQCLNLIQVVNNDIMILKNSIFLEIKYIYTVK